MSEQKEQGLYDIVGWRAWYIGGRTFDSKATAWRDLPAVGVLVIVLYQREAKRRRIMQGVTLYWKDGKKFCCDNTEDADIPKKLHQKFIKRGKWVEDAEYGSAQEAAFAAWESPDESLRIPDG